MSEEKYVRVRPALHPVLKVFAAQHGKTMQDVVEEGVAIVMGGTTATKQPVIDSQIQKTLKSLRQALKQALEEIEGVLAYGETVADSLDKIESQVAGITAGSGHSRDFLQDSGRSSSNDSSDGITKPRSRRAR